MQQFQVPQFIDVEDKIIGPLSLKQFFYLLIAGGAALILWKVFTAPIAIIIATPLVSFMTAMAFLKIHGRPFPTLVKSFIFYMMQPRLFLWKKTRPATRKKEQPEPKAEEAVAPHLTQSKLQELAWSLDIKEKIQR